MSGKMSMKNHAGSVIHIDSIAFGGRGVGKREDGKVVFVAGAIPGETIIATITREYKNYILAEIDELLVSSPDRMKPICDHFPLCGGCDWLHIAYAKQVEFKQNILISQLMHKCPMEETVIGEPVSSPADFGYRSHAILRCSYDNGFSMGFYQKSTNTVVSQERCPVLNARIQSVISQIRKILDETPVAGILSLEVHAIDEVLVRAVVSRKPDRNDLAVFREIVQKAGLTGLSLLNAGRPGFEQVFGKDILRYHIEAKGKTIKLSTGFGGFIQINAPVNEMMVNYVMDLAAGSERILDLYCGNGNFSIPLAFKAREVTGIERDPDLVRRGRESAEENRLTNMHFSDVDAEKAVQALSKEQGSFDTIILDPPREGAKNIMKDLVRLDPKLIIYISCDPSTLSRDLAILIQNGFGLKKIRLFDMFPQTYHLESVSCLERL
jgi:23S rRNA (uracil1939-C5)-methyltransferase